MFDTNWEDNIYSAGRHVNKYPYGEFVSVFFNALKYIETDCISLNKCKILELGCGTGNNLWFLAEQGHDVFGIDGSESAVKTALETLESRRVGASVEQAFFSNLPFDSESMDVIFDRESLYCGTTHNIKLSLKEVNRVLKKGGVFISFRFSDKHPTMKLLENGTISGKKIETNTWKDVSKGGFMGTGIVHFSSLDELVKQHGFLDLKYINEHTNTAIIKQSIIDYSEYILVGKKK